MFFTTTITLCTIRGTPKPQFSKCRKIQILIDSGVAENVVPPDLLPDYEVREGEARKNGVKYITAGGNEIPNLGELDLPFRTMEGHKCGIKFQLADVKRPLLSVTALTGTGDRVTFASRILKEEPLPVGLHVTLLMKIVCGQASTRKPISL